MKTINFRDLAGIPTQDGHVVKPGLVYRTGNLSHIDEQLAGEIINTTSIKMYIDFRSKGEVEQFGGPDHFTKNGIEWINLDIDSMDPDFLKLKKPEPSDWAKLYHKLFENNLGSWTKFLTLIAEAEKPLAYGCLFGKDRTGIATALLLDAIGVHHEDIATNFAETTKNVHDLHKYFSQFWNDRGLTEDEVFHHYSTAHPESIQYFMEYFRNEALANEAHEFTQHLSPKLIERLRKKLLFS